MKDKEKYIVYSFLAWLVIISIFIVNSHFNILNVNFMAYSMATAFFVFLIYLVCYEKKVEKVENVRKEFKNCKDKHKNSRCNYTKNGNVIYLKKTRKFIH